MSFKPTIFLALLSVMLLGSSSVVQGDQKMKAEEVVARHIESLGPVAQLSGIKTRIAVGTVVVNFRTPSVGQAHGRIVMASAGEKHLIGMIFDNSQNYPQEKIGYDAKNVTVSYVRPGLRSTLGDFLETHRSIVKQGLVGGSLTQAWPLLDLESNKFKLENAGTKKVGNREAYALRYVAKGSELDVTLFFDAETFQHVRTEYKRVVAAEMGKTPAQSVHQRESRYRMVEDYSEFRKEGELTLPHKYKISLEINLPGASFQAEWEANLAQFTFNDPIDPKSFDVLAN
ncbi:MAG TPA: hypothetical protein VJU86_09410 [Pyrinomonadaceae bacterium]|nr:hypothetical protein [Pyrinomonadaceae bacterium]